MSFLQDKLYPHLPVFAQNLGISAFGYQWYRRRFGGIFETEFRNCQQRESLTAQQWQNYQTVQLRRLLVHAWRQVPYYRQAFANSGLTLAQLEHFELSNMSRLPLLQKDTLRLNGSNTLLSAQREKGGSFFRAVAAQVHP